MSEGYISKTKRNGLQSALDSTSGYQIPIEGTTITYNKIPLKGTTAVTTKTPTEGTSTNYGLHRRHNADHDPRTKGAVQ